jgi:hypothetical protein
MATVILVGSAKEFNGVVFVGERPSVEIVISIRSEVVLGMVKSVAGVAFPVEEFIVQGVVFGDCDDIVCDV